MEQISSGNHEFFDRQIYAMASGSNEPSACAAEVLRAFGNALGEQPRHTRMSDPRSYVEAAGPATFPDDGVICAALAQHSASLRATALNPSVLPTVASDSSEDYNTGMKFELYQIIPSSREYVVVSHRERRSVVHRRTPHQQWRLLVDIVEGAVTVQAIGTALLKRATRLHSVGQRRTTHIADAPNNPAR